MRYTHAYNYAANSRLHGERTIVIINADTCTILKKNIQMKI
jgi:hypothetical protein